MKKEITDNITTDLNEITKNIIDRMVTDYLSILSGKAFMIGTDISSINTPNEHFEDNRDLNDIFESLYLITKFYTTLYTNICELKTPNQEINDSSLKNTISVLQTIDLSEFNDSNKILIYDNIENAKNKIYQELELMKTI